MPRAVIAISPRALAIGAGAIGALALAAWSASVATVLVIVWALLVVALSALRVRAAWSARAAARRGDALHDPPRGRDPEPFVSIHVPCCDEPPEIVAATLDALARLDWPAFEVIVLDNNTPDPATWRPLERHCERLGSRFRFHHVAALPGAKAAALNLCLAMSDPRTELVLTVDADYRVRPDALRRMHPLLGHRTSHVQAPQAYEDDGAVGLARAYASYFERYASAAGSGGMLLTGTLSLIRVEALRGVGGWCSATITEDADLGLRLLAAGWRGAYLPRVVGRGFMPDRLTELRKQRRRWVHGNAQVLFGSLRRVARLPRRLRATVAAQLTAWFQPWALPVLGFALFLGDAHRGARLVLAVSLLLYVAHELVLFIATPRRLLTARPLEGLGAHLALGWEGAVAWLEALAGVRLGFQRTSKRAGRGRGSSLARAGSALAAVGLAGFHGAGGEPLVAAACLFLAGLPLASHHLALALERGPGVPALGTDRPVVERT